MILSEKYVWAPPGAVPVEGVVVKVSKSEKWVDLETNKGVTRVKLPNGFLFKVTEEVKDDEPDAQDDGLPY